MNACNPLLRRASPSSRRGYTLPRAAFVVGAVIAVLVTAPVPALSAEVRVVADKLTVHAQDVPLRDLLQQFQEAGVRVRMDSRVNPRITANFDNRDMYQALSSLLSECDYGMVWSVVDGPAGRLKRIAQIDVFKPGDRSHAQPLPGSDGAVKRAEAPIKDKQVMIVKNEVLIRLRKGVDLASFQRLLTQIGGTAVESIPQLGLYRIRLIPGTDLAGVLKQLADSPYVASAEPNLVYQAPTPSRTGPGAATARAATTATSGRGGTVAVLDTGLKPDAGLRNNVVAFLDALDPERSPSDTLGHGTQMALLASGCVTPAGVDNPGAAAAVSVVPIRAFDDAGYASSFGLMSSMIFALDQNARVISLSWGSDTESRFVADAVAYAVARGAVVVAAAGNEPTGQPFYPAACPGVLAVSALSGNNEPWANSNYGDFVDLAAPGIADLPVGYNGPPGHYAGTSIAAAFTANAIARYFTLHPDADAAQALAALTNAVSRTSGTTRDPHLGAGRLDSAALAAFLK